MYQGAYSSDPPNYDKRIRNLSDRVAQLELAIEQLQGKNADDARSKRRVFFWGGWK
jgi:nicotinic acid mononucleotide adenylyltransferase